MDCTLEGPALRSIPLLHLCVAEMKRLLPSTVTFTSLREKPAKKLCKRSLPAVSNNFVAFSQCDAPSVGKKDLLTTHDKGHHPLYGNSAALHRCLAQGLTWHVDEEHVGVVQLANLHETTRW